jgi:hypothetical protein
MRTPASSRRLIRRSGSCWLRPSWRRRCSKTFPRKTSETGATLRCKAHLAVRPGRHSSAGALPGTRAPCRQSCHDRVGQAPPSFPGHRSGTHPLGPANRLLRREGWTVNHNQGQRLWQVEGLQRPAPRKRKRARPADGSVRGHRQG